MNYLGKEQTISIGGRPYRVGRFDLRVLNRWMEWAKKQIPSSLALLAPVLKDLPKELQEKLVAEAYAKDCARKDYFSPDIQSIATSIEGVAKLLCCLFQVYQVLSDDEAWALFQEAIEEHGEDRLRELLEDAQGRVPVDAGAAEDAVYREAGLIPPGSKKNEPSGLR